MEIGRNTISRIDDDLDLRVSREIKTRQKWDIWLQFGKDRKLRNSEEADKTTSEIVLAESNYWN